MINIIKTIAASFLALVLAGSAQATLVNFELTGTVDSVTTSNSSGLDVGSTITASGVFDDSVLTGVGLESISFADAGNDMTITAGSVIYTDALESTGGASLWLFDNQLDSLDYSATAGDFSSFFFDFISNGQFAGTWDAGTFTVTAVPVPAAVWLFGSGLLALVGLSRRK